MFPGINAFLRRAADEGVTDLKEELIGTIEQIKNANSETQQLNIATEAFGAEGAQRLVTAIRAEAFELDTLLASMDGADGASQNLIDSTRTMSEQFQIVRNRVTDVLSLFDTLPGPVQIAAIAFGGLLAVTGPLLFLLPSMVAGWNLVTGALARVNIQTIARTALTWLSVAATTAATVATTAFGVALTIATGPIGLVILAIAGLVAVGYLLWKHWDRVKAFFLGLWDRVTGVFQSKIGPDPRSHLPVHRHTVTDHQQLGSDTGRDYGHPGGHHVHGDGLGIDHQGGTAIGLWHPVLFADIRQCL